MLVSAYSVDQICEEQYAHSCQARSHIPLPNEVGQMTNQWSGQLRHLCIHMNEVRRSLRHVVMIALGAQRELSHCSRPLDIKKHSNL